MSIKEYLERVKKTKNGLWEETERIIMANEEEIVNLNRLQISKHENTQGGTLQHKENPPFSGTYAKATEEYALENNPYASITTKKAGYAYNFVWSGEFLEKFEIQMSADKKTFKIWSTELDEDSGKRVFFEGYSWLLGLTIKNQILFENQILEPNLKKYINKNLYK